MYSKGCLQDHITMLKRRGQLKKGANKGNIRNKNQKGIPRYGNKGVRQVALD